MVQIITADALEGLKTLSDSSVDMCVTSPPYYGLRCYGVDGQIGLEQTPTEYITRLVEVFREVKRVLKDNGTLWVNIGDSYCGTGHKGKYKDPKNKNGRNGQVVSVTNKVEGCKSKDLIGIPWMLAFALRADGWYLRNDIIWQKLNPQPESVKDRLTRSHEHIFLLSKASKYYFNNEAIKEPCVTNDTSIRKRDITKLNNTPGRSRMGGLIHNNYETRNKRDVWTVNTKPYKGAHFAVFPPNLIRPCILAGSQKDGIVLDPFIGSGTTAQVALEEGRKCIGIDLNPNSVKLIKERISGTMPQRGLFNE